MEESSLKTLSPAMLEARDRYRQDFQLQALLKAYRNSPDCKTSLSSWGQIQDNLSAEAVAQAFAHESGVLEGMETVLAFLSPPEE